ncbi:MAG: dipicolinic acid synthetase subunit A [Bacillaceae bacterium]|nr:dipicolinic acid synthetase subunit A [Bacillaceae bacterium]
MLTGMKVAVIGGDARQVELIKNLCEWDATLYLVSLDNLEGDFPGAQKVKMDEVPRDELDAIVLPVPGTDDEGYMETHFADESPRLTKTWLEGVKSSCLVFTGITKDYLTNLCNELHLKLIPLFDRNDVAIYNSIPTVEGTIMMAIQHTEFTIHNSNVTIVGFGRTGKSLARSFHALGANVKASARKKEDLARIFEMGIKPIHTNDLSKEVKDCHILINTVPSPVINVKVLQNLPQHALIIDLASKPGGTDFRYAKKRGINAILAPGLPGIVAPNTAGNILATVISQILLEEKGERSS